MDWTLSGSNSGKRKEIFFCSPKCPYWLGGTFSLLSICAVVLPGDEVAGHDVDHSPPSSAEVKNEWN